MVLCAGGSMNDIWRHVTSHHAFMNHAGSVLTFLANVLNQEGAPIISRDIWRAFASHVVHSTLETEIFMGCHVAILKTCYDMS